MPEPASGQVAVSIYLPLCHHIRQATTSDYEALVDLERRAFIELGAAFYPLEDIECALNHFEGLSLSLIKEGHYFVLTDVQERILAAGGWTLSELEYIPSGNDVSAGQAGVVRCIYVAPQYARMGFAQKMLHCIEMDARSVDICQLTLTASKTAEALYLRAGYLPGPYHNVRLPNGHDLPLRSMKKTLASKTT